MDSEKECQLLTAEEFLQPDVPKGEKNSQLPTNLSINYSFWYFRLNKTTNCIFAVRFCFV